MKKTILFSLLIGMSLATLANPIDVETARNVAENFFKSTSAQACTSKRLYRASGKVDMQLVYEPSMNTRASHAVAEYYVFAPMDSVGFVIVAGDDEVTPIVGYSTTSRFVGQHISPALSNYLSAYCIYMNSVWDGKAVRKTQMSENVTPVFPFISTTWNQDYPYNKDCPKIGGNATYTGCVPTVVAQIMNYYKWPNSGHGTCTATLNDASNTAVSTTLGEEYQWDNMIDNYYPADTYTTIQANAVSQLMKDVGYACSVHYGTDVTNAFAYNALTALLRHFDYSPDILFVDRRYYSDMAWNKMIYNELKEGRPVWYRGNNEEGKEGHAFLCCGVDQQGSYYINWGWGGWCDGYFDLDAVAPNGYDFSYDQQAIINIKPIEDGESEKDYKVIPHVGNIEITEQDNSILTPKVTYTIYVTNTTDCTITGQTGYAVFIDGKMISSEIYPLITYRDVLPDWYWWYSNQWIRWDIAPDAPQGLKEVRFFWQPDGETEWYEPFGEHTIYILSTEEGHYFSTDKEEFGDIVGIKPIQAGGLRIEPFKGGVGLTSSEAVKVGIYRINGILLKVVELMPDQKQICPLPQGVYLVNGAKIVID